MAPRILSQHGGASIPLPGQVVSVMLSLAATTALTLFLTQRVIAIKVWRRLPLVVWRAQVVFAIYADSYIFVFATAMLQHSLGVNSGHSICDAAIIICLVCYVTTKFIYLFLAEKAYIIRATPKSRLESKLYLVNSFGMLSIYVAVVILNFVYRIARMEDGQCIIGMQSIAMIPLISFDTVVNVYLTIIFLIPLKNLYSYTNMPRTRANIRLRMVAFRTFCGAVCTLLSSIVNLSVLMSLNGEPGWVCLMCCNCDIIFSAMVIQWVTSKDNAGTLSGTSSREGGPPGDFAIAASGPVRAVNPSDAEPTPASTLAEISLMPTRSRSHRAGSYNEDEDEDEETAAAKSTAGVVVTTTIEHESESAARGYDEYTTTATTATMPGAATASAAAAGGLPSDGRFVVSQTSITAGPQLWNAFDRRNSPSCCKISCSK